MTDKLTKLCKVFKQVLHKRRYSNSQYTQENVLSFIGNQENEN